jgi:hypothetical protein
MKLLPSHPLYDSACALLAHAKVAIIGIAMTTVVASAQIAPAVSRSPVDAPRVRASRDELRIVFPRDTAHHWGWSAPLQPGYRARYSWEMDIHTIGGESTVGFAVSSVALPREFRSPEELLGVARGYLCSRVVYATCTEIDATASFEDGRPVFTVRDRASISWLFAMRPTFVRLSRDRPEATRIDAWDGVRVEYRAPSVAPLDSAIRATAVRASRLEHLERFRVSRGIVGGGALADGNLIVVGDSAPLWLAETQSSYDTGTSGQRDLTDSGWTVLDPRVARLQRPSATPIPMRERLLNGPPRMYVKALRAGTATIRVRGVHGRLDAALESEPAPGMLERTIVVSRPPQRLEITPRPDTLRMGEPLVVRVRVYDAQGEYTDRASLWLESGERDPHYYDGSRPARVSFMTPGRKSIVARLGALADTLTLIVVDSATTPPPR